MPVIDANRPTRRRRSEDQLGDPIQKGHVKSVTGSSGCLLHNSDQGRSPRPHARLGCGKALACSSAAPNRACGQHEQRPWGSNVRSSSPAAERRRKVLAMPVAPRHMSPVVVGIGARFNCLPSAVIGRTSYPLFPSSARLATPRAVAPANGDTDLCASRHDESDGSYTSHV